MTTLRTIITDAFRESGILAAGETPPADEFDEALRRLQNIIKSVYGSSLGENLRSISYGDSGLTNTYAKDENQATLIDNSYVPYNVRLQLNLGAAKTLYLHPNPYDGARFGVVDNGNTVDSFNITLHGNGRNIEEAVSVVLSTEGLSREWFFRGDIGNWARVTDLTADDQSPFPAEFDDYLQTWLSIRIHPRYNIDTKGETTAIFNQMRSMFRSRYRQKIEMPVEEALLHLSADRSKPYSRVRPDDFERGIL